MLYEVMISHPCKRNINPKDCQFQIDEMSNQLGELFKNEEFKNNIQTPNESQMLLLAALLIEFPVNGEFDCHLV